MSSSPLARAARVTTAPVRNFFNQHFEMVKTEVRLARQVDLDVEQLDRIENTLIETSFYQAQLVARLREELTEANARIGELEHRVAIVADAVAAFAAPGSEIGEVGDPVAPVDASSA